MTTLPKKPTLPTMQKVKSTSLHSLGHEGNTLTAKFANGGIYQYHGVSADIFNQLLNAESAGKAFQELVRARHKGVKVEA